LRENKKGGYMPPFFMAVPLFQSRLKPRKIEKVEKKVEDTHQPFTHHSTSNKSNKVATSKVGTVLL